MAVIEDVVLELGRIGLWIQAIGLVIVLWILFQLINFYFSRKRRKALYEISDRLDRMEKKIDKLSRGKKK